MHGYPRTRMLFGAILLATSAIVMAACGSAPQQAPATQPTTAVPPSGQGDATAYPAPQGGAATTYPAPQGGVATAYPAPQGGAATAYPAPQADASRPTIQAATQPALSTRPPGLATSGPSPAGTPATPLGGGSGEVPAEKIAAALADLAQRSGVNAAQMTVVRAEAVEWRDGSLGCPRPDMVYPQVITPGYRLVLSAGGREYAYHASERGEFFYCENPAA